MTVIRALCGRRGCLGGSRRRGRGHRPLLDSRV